MKKLHLGSALAEAVQFIQKPDPQAVINLEYLAKEHRIPSVHNLENEANERQLLHNLQEAAKQQPGLIRSFVAIRLKLWRGEQISQEEANLLLVGLKCRSFPLDQLNLAHLEFDQLDLSHAEFKSLKLNDAQIDGDLNLEGAEIKGHANLKRLRVKGDLNQKRMQVGGNYSEQGQHVSGESNQYQMRVRGNSYHQGKVVERDWSQSGAHIHGDSHQKNLMVSGNFGQINAMVDGCLDQAKIKVGGHLNQSSLIAGHQNLSGFVGGGWIGGHGVSRSDFPHLQHRDRPKRKPSQDQDLLEPRCW